MAVPARRSTTTTKLKNAYSQSPRIFETIQSILAKSGVREVHYEYDATYQGRVVALSFSIMVNGRLLSFRLPANVQAVELLLYGTNKYLSDAKRDQAYRTAWATIRDWLDAQMAIIKTGMVKPQEAFLPYLLDEAGQQTLYQRIEEQQFRTRLLEAPKSTS